MIEKKKFAEIMLSALMFIFSVLQLIIIKDEYSYNNKCLLGVLIVIISIMLLFKYRKDRFYIILFAIILYINFTICVSDCFVNGFFTVPLESQVWQNLRQSQYEIIFLKCLLLFLSTINVFATRKTVVDENRELENRSNILVFIFGLILMSYALLNGYMSSVASNDAYVSDTSTLFEYCTVFYLLTWLYSGKSKYRKYILWGYAGAYILVAIAHGDRSSAFPMLILVILLYFPKIPLKRMFLFMFSGIFAANLIAAYRETYSLSSTLETFGAKYGLKSICSDTVSFSYYTGLSITYVRDVLGNTAKYFIDFLGGIIFGGSFGKADVTTFCRTYAMNKGGGMCIANFYFWFGKWGIVILSTIVIMLLYYLSKSKSKLGLVMKVYLSVNVFRWYLYSSFDLFRGVLFVLPVSYLIFLSIDSFTRRRG